MRAGPLLTGALTLLAAPALSGCAIALPLAAVGALGKASLDVAQGKSAAYQRELRGEEAAPATVASAAAPTPAGRPTPTDRPTLSGSVTGADQDDFAIAAVLSDGRMPAPGERPLTSTTAAPTTAAPPAAARLPERPASASGAPASPFALMADYVLAQGQARAAGGTVRSAVLAPGVKLDEPRFVPCEDRPLAALIDLDAEGGVRRPLDPASVPASTSEAAVALHAAGVRLLFVSDRPVSQAATVRQALARTGLYTDGDQLLLADGRRKQERRWAAARTQCVVALLGDQRSDMDELYDYLRKPEAAHMLNGLWNAGWFLAPPPITPEDTR